LYADCQPIPQLRAHCIVILIKEENMEALFATVAQISFTIVGLFFVVLTVDSDSRDFWSGQKPQSQYAYLNLLDMLLPGLFAVGALINLSEGSFPSWPIVALLLFLFLLWIYFQLKTLKKSQNYQEIIRYESILEVPQCSPY
jgi:hypothetical protein